MIEKIGHELKHRPMEALRAFEASMTEGASRRKQIAAAHAQTMELVRFARDMTTHALIHEAPLRFSSPRQSDRRLLVAACVDRFVELGAAGAERTLHDFGVAFGVLVLEGTQQQQFCGRLAVELGHRTNEEVEPLLKSIAMPLIEALKIVLRVGAAPTRDSAVEGLGGLLKFFPPPSALFHGWPRPDAATAIDSPGEEETQNHIDRVFYDRLERRRMMVLAVAGDADARRELFKLLDRPIASVVQAIRSEALNASRLNRALLDALHSRADHLRTLPGLVRQAAPQEQGELRERAVRYLRDAAGFAAMKNTDDRVLAAFGQFQESVFRTIDVMIKRHPSHEDFDAVLALALHEMPRTLVGHSSVCNARVRATFALISTASRLISLDAKADHTRKELHELFKTFDGPSLWPNLGIAEGCYYVIPFLADKKANDELLMPALTALFQRLSDPPSADQLDETHHQLIAAACFRRLILALLERTEEVSAQDAASDGVERDVSRLIAKPDGKSVLEAFQNIRPWSKVMAVPRSSTTTGIVIAGTAFDTELLTHSDALFDGFDERPSVLRLLLTRILAAQLRAASQDWREIERHAQLRGYLSDMPTVSLSEVERIKKARQLVGKLPAHAAQAADPDLQDFLEYCGRRSSEDSAGHGDELPDHVLAMVSDNPSSRIADAIAREIELIVQRHKRDETFDLGKALYQVVLRGPNDAIFQHLLPRMEDAERSIVELFQKYVDRVRATTKLTPTLVLGGVRDLVKEIGEPHPSATLCKLRLLLQHYEHLFADEPAIWKALLEDGGLSKIFLECDNLMTMTSGTNPKPRPSLVDAFSTDAAELESQVLHYRDLPVAQFELRAAALKRASDIARKIAAALENHPRLQPPERIVLAALLEQLQSFFARTIRWYCDEPRRRKTKQIELQDPEMFLVLFASPPTTSLVRIFEANSKLAQDDRVDAKPRDAAKEISDEIQRIVAAHGSVPPEFPEQRARFEKLFADWMKSELHPDMLQHAFEQRWTRPFRWVYRTLTKLRGVSMLMIIPCLIAAILHYYDAHDWEGAGFFALETGVLIAALRSLVPALGTSSPPPAEPYYREALLLRFAQLIAVPMALSVEFEHSYSFPLHASFWALSLLMTLSYFTTRYIVDVETVGARRSSKESETQRVSQVIALAWSHAFIIAVLLATIFGSHARGIDAEKGAVLPAGHEHPLLAGVLPRDARFEAGKLLQLIPAVPRSVVHQLEFTFYPTIILAWTALGLFIGVFLEGFGKGERLRGETKDDVQATE